MLLFTCFFTLCLVKYLWDRRHLYALSYRMPGPIGYPLVGSAYMFADSTKIVEAVTHLDETYSKLFKFWMGNKLMVFSSKAEDMEIILNSPQCVDKGASYTFLSELTGTGLITLKNNEWSVRRKLLNPSFHYTVLQKFMPIFNKNVKVLIANLYHLKGVIDICEPLKKCSMDMICETSMDLEMQTQSENNPEFLRAWDMGLEIAGDRIFKPWLQYNVIYHTTKLFALQKKSLQIIHKTASDTIKAKCEKYTKEVVKTKPDKEEFMLHTEKHTFIDLALKLAMEEHSLSFEDVHNEMNNILVAGYKTTATTSSHVILMLAMFPEYQQQVYDEIMSSRLADDDMVTSQDFAALPFTDRFIKETMRLLPPIPYLSRTCSKALQLGEYTIPPGVEFALSIQNVHRSSQHYPDPHRFNPDHFLPENVAKRHPYSFLPFSSGTRTCIGSKYAQNVIKTIIIHVVKNFRVTTSLKFEDLRFRMSIELVLLNKHMVQLHARE